MEKVLFDTNVILDIALKRNSFFDNAVQIFGLIDQGIIQGHITAATVTDIYYISKKVKGHDLALEFISNVIEIVEVIGVDKQIIVNAIKSNFKDFEDAVQVFSAASFGIETVITRNVKDFEHSNLKVFSPSEFLKNQIF
ncbi:MAG: PIN domain-containing protein [Cyclobacterium sp.]|uniref:type II toxin-antitoxin system VapC family toxin n=1 Tax=unclassified Cyclobacterium TaxID=2615055 RepID=UPI0013D3024A|nr:PIN domain-containing protein [Cyclobacterium sp. SYSU L10401]